MLSAASSRGRLWALVLVLVAVPTLVRSVPTASASSADTYIGCGSLRSWVASEAPRACFFGWPDESLDPAFELRQTRWSGWGGPDARGTALYDGGQHVTVQASNRRFCGPYHLYTRVRVYYEDGSLDSRIPSGCTGGNSVSPSNAGAGDGAHACIPAASRPERSDAGRFRLRVQARRLRTGTM